MRFSSDRQRRAVFANIFSKSNRFALYVDDKSKRIRSTEYPSIDFKVIPKDTLLPETVENINKSSDVLPESDFSGLETLNFVDKIRFFDHENPFKSIYASGAYLGRGMAGRDFDGLISRTYAVPVDKYERYANKAYGYDHNTPNAEKVLVDDYVKLRREYAANAPIIRIDRKTRDQVGTLAHELGHHIVADSGYIPVGGVQEGAAILYASELGVDDIQKLKDVESVDIEEIEDLLGYSKSLHELKNPSYKKLTKYTGAE